MFVPLAVRGGGRARSRGGDLLRRGRRALVPEGTTAARRVRETDGVARGGGWAVRDQGGASRVVTRR